MMKRVSSALVQFTGFLSTSNAVVTAASSQHRSYRTNIDPDLLPQGAKTSNYQSSSVPSERRAVLQEYAIAPLFGSRMSALLIGSTISPREFIQKKKNLAAIIEDILELKEGTVTLGETQWLSTSPLPRHNGPQFRRTDYTTATTLANCLVGVYLPSEIDLLDHIELGMKLADAITGSAPDSRLTKDNSVTYCEFEVPDLKQYHPDKLLGEEVDPDVASMVMERWLDRIQDQLSLWEANKEADQTIEGGGLGRR